MIDANVSMQHGIRREKIEV